MLEASYSPPASLMPGVDEQRNKPRIIEGPKEFEGKCTHCHTKFVYTYSMTKTVKNGHHRSGQLWKTGLDCPTCNQFYIHKP